MYIYTNNISNVYFMLLDTTRVFEKETIKCRTGREAVTNFDPSIYEGEMVLNASVEGTLGNEENISINRAWTKA